MIVHHVGCGPNKNHEGWINSDKEEFDLLHPDHWGKIEKESVDAFVSHHVLQEFHWRELVVVLVMMHDHLKKGGVIRMGIPHIDSGKPLDFILGWGNVTILSEELMTKVLDDIGFDVYVSDFGSTTSDIEDLAKGDNRPDETLFLEAFKR